MPIIYNDLLLTYHLPHHKLFELCNDIKYHLLFQYELYIEYCEREDYNNRKKQEIHFEATGEMKTFTTAGVDSKKSFLQWWSDDQKSKRKEREFKQSIRRHFEELKNRPKIKADSIEDLYVAEG